MRTPLLLTGLIAAPLIAGQATAGTVTVTIPQLPVAEYHRPYVAGWIEPAGGGAARTLFVWYDLKHKGAEPGTKWLADLRSWWRKGGRNTALPANGVSGATRAPGSYTIPLPADLRGGQYIVYVEAARETGGRDIVSVPITVPGNNAVGKGKTELGSVTVSSR